MGDGVMMELDLDVNSGVDRDGRSGATVLKRKASEQVAVEGTPMNWESFYKNYRKPDYIPGYQLLNKLGGGVFGFVYKARKESIGKNYAIKFLKVDDENVKKAVMHELEAIKFFAQVDHPHLVSIEDKGEVDGVPFIIMGYAGEETLKKRFEEKSSTPTQALNLFRQILSGVAALHEKSIIHFDLKPGNVFLKGDFARVGDYGLSRLMSESRKTLSFGRGTPYYMAPELLKKKGDNRSDIYSLGVILFEMLTGEVPFQGDSEWEVLKKHEEESIKFPSKIDSQLQQLISRMMAKKPEDRYQSVKDIVDDVDAYLAGGAGGSGGATGNRRKERVDRKKKTSWGGGTIPKWGPSPSREPDKGGRGGAGGIGGMAREDWAEFERAFREAGVEVRRAGHEIKNAGVEGAKALKEVGQIGGQVATTLGGHLKNHMLVPLVMGLDIAREKLVGAIAGNSKESARARAIASRYRVRPEGRRDPYRQSVIPLFFRSFFQILQVAILAAIVPVRYIGSAIGHVLEFVLKLPFRVFGFVARVVLVFFGVSIIFFMIFALVYFVAHIPSMMRISVL